MEKKQILIKGMHCKSCEMLIEDNLKEVCGVEKCEVSYAKKGAVIYYDGKEPKMEEIEKAVLEAGYEIGEEKEKGFLSQNINDYKDLLIVLFIAFAGYYMLKGLGITDLNFNYGSGSVSLPVVFLIGLTAGISTCMALVGGLIFGMSAKHAEKHPEAKAMEKFRPHLFFNLGRVVGFGVLGGVLGAAGSSFELSSSANGILIILVGIVMLILGLQLIEIFPWLNNFKITLPKGISKILGINHHEKEYSHRKAVALGALTFFLPCGFTQAMQVYALGSGSFVSGALIMSLFALGTAPGLLGIGGLTSLVKGIFARRFFKFAGVVVILLSIFNINNGLKLTGYEIDWSSSVDSSGKPSAVISNDPNVKIENGVQVVKMTENNRGYSPNKFTIIKDIPVRWVIDAQAPNSCASALVVPKLKIRKFLSAGENIIEFTPTEAGKLAFSCSMGMYSGSFNVVDSAGGARNIVDQAQAAEEDAVTSACGINNDTGGSCGGSCGGGCGCGKNSN